MRTSPATLQFDHVSPIRAIDEITAQLRELIADGKLRPGDRLPAERDLSARLGVSRNTLREALRALENAGIVEMRKGASGGAFVLPGDPGVIVTGMRDLYHLGRITPLQLTEARIQLSEVVVRMACERATADDFARLEANVAAARVAHSAGLFDERQRLHREFHVLLAAATGNPIIETTMAAIMGVFGEFIRRIGPGENPFTLPSRRRFMKHLRSRDAAAANAEMTRHLGRLHDQYLARLSQASGRGSRS